MTSFLLPLNPTNHSPIPVEMKQLLFAALLGLLAIANVSAQTAPGPQIYEWRVYTLRAEGDAAAFDAFLSEQLIPAYNRHGCLYRKMKYIELFRCF